MQDVFNYGKVHSRPSQTFKTVARHQETIARLPHLLCALQYYRRISPTYPKGTSVRMHDLWQTILHEARIHAAPETSHENQAIFLRRMR